MPLTILAQETEHEEYLPRLREHVELMARRGRKLRRLVPMSHETSSMDARGWAA